MIKIRGNRVVYIPAADVDLPDAEQRRFTFSNPSSRSYDRLVEKHSRIEDGKNIVQLGDIANALLRGWSLRTDDVEVAKKYGATPAEKTRCIGIPVPFPDETKDIDLLDFLRAEEWKALMTEVWAAVNPVPSGNSGSPASSPQDDSAASAGQTSADPTTAT